MLNKLTSPNQPRNMCVTRHLPVRNLLDRAVHRVEKGFGFVCSWHVGSWLLLQNVLLGFGVDLLI